jgi:hypothetical protein
MGSWAIDVGAKVIEIIAEQAMIDPSDINPDH